MGYATARGQSTKSLSVSFSGADFDVTCGSLTHGSRVCVGYRVTWSVRSRSYSARFRSRDAAARFAAAKLPVVLAAAGVAS